MTAAKITCLLVQVWLSTPEAVAHQALCEVYWAKDAIYGTGKLEVRVLLTDRAVMAAEYTVRISSSIDETIVGKKSLAVSRDNMAVAEFEMDDVRDKTDARYRVELFIDGVFAEAIEGGFTLWPVAEAYMDLTQHKTIWVFDPAGALQQRFHQTNTDFMDAAFQPVRDFVEPDVIFIGEQLELSALEEIERRLDLVDSNATVVFFRQNELPASLPVRISRADSGYAVIDCNIDAPMLEKLDKLDIMRLAQDAAGGLRLQNRGREVSASSYVTALDGYGGFEKSLLLSVKYRRRCEIYCQLPITPSGDPRCDALFKNIVRLACLTTHTQQVCDNER